MTKETLTLIEAAEKMKNEVSGVLGFRDDGLRAVLGNTNIAVLKERLELLEAAISSAKAAEEGVEVIPVNEAVSIAENTLTPSSNITQIRSVEKVVAALRNRS